MSELFTQLYSSPINSLIVTINIGIFAYMWNYRIGYEQVAVSYKKCIIEKHLYRIITSTFCHASFLHVLMNMSGLWSLGAIEAARGSIWYIETTAMLLLLSMAILLIGIHICVYRFGMREMAETSAVGYSGVLFGWMTLTMLLNPTFGFSLPGSGYKVPLVVMPFVYLFLTKLLVPISSFSGHFSGIIAGYIIGWGLLDGLRGYWLWTSLIYISVILLLSLSMNSSLPRWFRDYVVISPELSQATSLEGLTTNQQEGAISSVGPVQPRMVMDSQGNLRAYRVVDNSNIVV